MGADFGTLQLLDLVTGSLRFVTQSGFDAAFLDYCAVVDDDHSACGRAARQGAQAVITDVAADPAFAPSRGIAAASGFRAVRSTPLADDAGRTTGMVSTHFRHPHRQETCWRSMSAPPANYQRSCRATGAEALDARVRIRAAEPADAYLRQLR